MNTITLIIGVVLCITAIILLVIASAKYNKAQGIIDSVALIMSRIKIENKVEKCSSDLHEGENTGEKLRTVIKGLAEYPTEPQKPQRIYDINLSNARYSGVIHTFKRDGKNKERPVMTYKWMNEDIYFEYAEDGSPVRINGQARIQVLNVLRGEKSRNFKVYELK